MNNNDLLLGGGSIPNIGGPKVDPRDYPSIKCKKCGSIIFKSAMVLKEIPGTIVGYGTDPVSYPMQVFICDKCGEILESDVKAYKLENDIKENIDKASNVHIENNTGNILIT